MSVISVKKLLEAGIHFGHQTKRWNPNMKKYIYTSRNGIHIIDLEQTVKHIESAYKFTKEQAQEGKTFLFVGTKKQAQDSIKEEAERCGMYYINSRWLGGTLTNFKTIRSRVDRLKAIDKMEAVGEFELLPKKEVIQLNLERDKLNKNLGGVREMTKLPDIVFLIDTNKENIAVKEANKLGIPIIGLCDTNSDPRDIDVIIPGNDDAIRAVKLVSNLIANAIIEANEGEMNEEDDKKIDDTEINTEKQIEEEKKKVDTNSNNSNTISQDDKSDKKISEVESKESHEDVAKLETKQKKLKDAEPESKDKK